MTTRRRSRRRLQFVRAQLGQSVETIGKDRRRLTVVVVGSVLVLAIGVTTWEAFRAVSSIGEAERTSEVLTDDIVEGDVDAARVSLEKLDESTSRAANSTNGPIWWLGAHVPFLGRNVDALRTAAREIDQVTDEALPGIVDVADKVRLETFRPKDGRIDLAAVADAAPAIARANQVLADANRDIAAFDVDGLIGPIRQPMSQLQAKFESTAVAAGAANEATNLLPSMLAADGKKRVYLLMIMNNAEIRSLAGMPGSVAEITAKNGMVKMGDQGGIQDIKPLKEPPSKLTEAEKGVFQTSVATDMRDTAVVPHFPRAAELTAAVVGKRWKEKYDGVIAVDPVSMGYMLAGLGPVAIGDGETINATNAVATLLNGVYLKYPTDAVKQDDVFEVAAKRIFDAMVDGSGRFRLGDPGAGARCCRAAASWCGHVTKASRSASRPVGSSPAPSTSGSGRPQVGVFVNDGAGSEDGVLPHDGHAGSFGAVSSTMAHRSCKLTTTLLNNAPANAAQLPPSVTGFGDIVTRGQHAAPDG